MVRLAVTIFAALLLVQPASAQDLIGPPAPGQALSTDTLPVSPAGARAMTADPTTINPASVLDQAGRMLPGADPDAPGLSAAINIMVLLTVITLVPSIMLATTCFVRIMIVLGLLRQAIGTQTLPPGQVITALALFMTLMVMSPTLERIWNEAIVPYQNGEIRDYDTLWVQARQPMRDFMFDQIEATGNWSSLYMVLNYRGEIDISDPGSLTRADVDTASLIPAFMLSELKTAFLMGFRVYLPFLVIDMVIASLLISMSMMMLPPVLISLPFKLLMFVLVDGWTLVVGSLLTSFKVGEDAPRPSMFEQAMAVPWEIFAYMGTLAGSG